MKHTHVLKALHWLLILAAVIAVILLALLTARLVTTKTAPSAAASFDGSQVEFPGALTSQWYIIKGTTLVGEAGPTGYASAPVDVHEAAPFLDPGETVTIASPKGSSESVLGIIRNNSNFLPIVEDGDNLQGLAVRPDGLSVYGDDVLGLVPAWHLFLLNVQQPKVAPKDLGEGRSPRVAGDGTILALTPQGLSRFDVLLHTETTLIPDIDAEDAGGALSPGATVAALPNASSSAVDFYQLASPSPFATSTLGFLPGEPGGGIAFVNDQYFIVLSNSGAAVLYQVPQRGQAALPVETLTVQSAP